MTLTPSYIESRFDKYNKLYFNNEIKQKPLFIVSHAKTQLGLFHYEISDDYKEIHNCIIKVTDYYDRTEKQYDNTIIHEMIHMYLTLKYKRHMGHGAEFKAECRRINKFGWNISRCTSGWGLKVSSKYRNNKKDVKPINMAYFKMNDMGDYLLFAICDSNVCEYKDYLFKHYNDVHFFTLTNEKLSLVFKKCRKKISGQRFFSKDKMMSYLSLYGYHE